ncbi:MAG: MFS transporter [Anaerolineales bacterium]
MPAFLITALTARMNRALETLPMGFWLATAASVFYFFAIQMTFPLIPLFVQNELGAAASFVGTAVLVVTLAEILSRLPSGAWSDRVGRRRVMLVGGALGVFYLVTMALTQSRELFLAGRLVHGFSLAIYLTAMKAYIADVVPPERRGEAFGINTSGFSLALILGPLSGEALMNGFGFRVAFWVAAVLSLGALVFTLMLPQREERITSDVSMWRGSRKILALRGAWASLFTSFAGASIFVLFFVYFPLYAEHRDLAGQAPGFLAEVPISVAFSLFALVNFFVLPRAGRYSDRRGRFAGLVPGMFIMLPGIALMGLVGNIWLIYLAVIIVSFGFSYHRAMMDALMQDACPPRLRGLGTAIMFTGWGAAIGVGSQLYGTIIEAHGFTWLFILTGVQVLLLSIPALGLARRIERERRTAYKGVSLPIQAR